MADSIRRWIGGGDERLPTAVGGGVLVLVALAVAQIPLSGPLRVSWYCNDGPPGEPCICYRAGDEPRGFDCDVSTMGPAADAKRTALVLFIAGMVCLGARFVQRRLRRGDATSGAPEGLFKALPGIGVVLALAAALVLLYSHTPRPCDDQGAFGFAGGERLASCDTS